MEGDENIGVVNSPRLIRKANVLQPSTVHNIQGSPKKLTEGLKKTADPFAVIRQLDDNERWVERTSIITRQDHEDNIVFARQILQDLVYGLPLNRDGCNVSQDKSPVSSCEETSKNGDVEVVAANTCTPSAENKSREVTVDSLEDDKDVISQKPVAETDTSKDFKEKTLDDMTNVGYDIDFDHLDEINPFATSKQLMNSPVGKTSMEKPIDSLTRDEEHMDKSVQNTEDNNKGDVCISFDEVDEHTDPFKSRSQIMNSPVAQAQMNATSCNNSAIHPKDDLNETKDLNCTTVGSAKQSTNSGGDNLESQRSEFTINLDEIDETLDPFKPSKQIANSPERGNEPATYTINLDENDETDPFKPKLEICNSPVSSGTAKIADQSQMSDDPFQAKSQIANSPVKKAACCIDEVDGLIESFKTKAVIINSPVSSAKYVNTDEIEDPFKTTSMVANSPVIAAKPVNIEEVEDPFKTKSMVANSPVIAAKPVNTEEVEDPFKTKSMVANSPVIAAKPVNTEEVEDPFKTKSMVANSPVCAAKPTNAEDVEDPFKTKSMVANSPVRAAKPANTEEVEDVFKTKSMDANSPVSAAKQANVEEVEDPFKTKSMVANSPVSAAKPMNTEEVEDPFKTKSMVANSPVSSAISRNTEGVEDPFKTKSLAANSPSKPESFDSLETSGDVFKPKSKVANTPTKSPRKVHFQDGEQTEGQAEVDPFKSKSKVANSSKQSPVQKSTDSKSLSPKKTSSDLQADPFKPRNQLGNSPTKTTQKSHSATSTVNENTQPRWQNANSISRSPIKSPSQSPRRVASAAQSPRGLPKTSPAKSPGRSPSKKATSSKSPLRSPSKNCSPNCKSASLTKSPPIRDPPRNSSPTTSPPIQPPSKIGPAAQKLASTFSMSQTTGESAAVPKQILPHTTAQPPTSGSRGEGLMGRLPDVFSRAKTQLSDITEEEFGDELFQPASEVFANPAFDASAWDMLANVGSGEVAPDLTRESLYCKFDPLVKPRQSIARNAEIQKRMSFITGQAKRQSLQLIMLGEENLLGTPDHNKMENMKTDFLEQMGSSVDDIFDSRSPSAYNRPSNPVSFSNAEFVEPHNPVNFSNADLVEVLQYSEKEMKKICSELKLEFQSNLLIKEKAWHEKCQEMEEEFKAQLTQANQKLKEAEATIAEQENENYIWRILLNDYAKTLADVIGQDEKDKEKFQKTLDENNLQKEKALEDAESADKMFKDLHVRYEKLRSTVELQQKNEENLRKGMTELKGKLEKATVSFKALKQQAEEKLEKARIREEKLEQKMNAVVTRLEASLKKKTGELEALESSFKQKMKQNEELAQLCDELITKVGD